MTYLCMLKMKTAKEVREAFVEFKNVFEQDGRRIWSLRTDGGGEYEKEIRRLMREHGIKHEVTPPYTPEQNGVAERANRTICERIRAILIETGLPKHLWGELARTVAYLKNRSPTHALDGKTPYEALYGKKPDVSHLIAIGTRAFVHITKKKTKKMDPRSKEGIMVGYGGEHIYRVWDPDSTNVWASCDVRFIGEAREAKEPDAKPEAKPEAKEKVVYDTIEVLPIPKVENRDEESEMESENEDQEDQEVPELDSDENGDNEDIDTIPCSSIEPETYVSAPTSPQTPVTEPEESNTAKVRTLRESKRSNKGVAPEKFDPSDYTSSKAQLAMTSMWSESAEPRTYHEAINHPTYGKEWEQAIQAECNSLMKNGAWELVQPPHGANIVTCKWVFKMKHDANGNVVRFKARLVARGFSQVYDIDYMDTYAPVAKLTTYRIIFALAALEQWEVHGMDVITAFLLGKLDEDIYMMQPEGFTKRGKKNLVCKLRKSLYGLK